MKLQRSTVSYINLVWHKLKYKFSSDFGMYFNPMEEPPGAEWCLTEDLQRPWISTTGCHRAAGLPNHEQKEVFQMQHANSSCSAIQFWHLFRFLKPSFSLNRSLLVVKRWEDAFRRGATLCDNLLSLKKAHAGNWQVPFFFLGWRRHLSHSIPFSVLLLLKWQMNK